MVRAAWLGGWIASCTCKNRRVDHPRVREHLGAEEIAGNIPSNAVGVGSYMIIIELDKEHASGPPLLNMCNHPPHVVIAAATPVSVAALRDPKGLP